MGGPKYFSLEFFQIPICFLNNISDPHNRVVQNENGTFSFFKLGSLASVNHSGREYTDFFLEFFEVIFLVEGPCLKLGRKAGKYIGKS